MTAGLSRRIGMSSSQFYKLRTPALLYDNMDTLRMLLKNMFDNNPLLTWSMYTERSGNIMMKVRFGDIGNEEGLNSNLSYKRKSENQIRRDTKRAQQYACRHVTHRNKF